MSRESPAAPLTVLKFGSSVLASEDDLPRAVHEIYRHVRMGHRVVAVVSAIGNATDTLLARARRASDNPEAGAQAALLSTGELASAALAAIALDRAGVPATLFDARSAGLRSQGPELDADPCGLDSNSIGKALAARPVAVLPGYIACNLAGGTSLLGRGGSDLTALFLAERLGAGSCRLLKVFDGYYESDPATSGTMPAQYRQLSYDDALRLDAPVVQEKALRFAKSRGIAFEVASVGSSEGTRVGPETSRLRRAGVPPCRPRPIRVSLVGLGTVGLGVYRHLLAEPERFAIAGIWVREPARYLGENLPPGLLRSDLANLTTVPSDVVVESISGADAAAALIAGSLESGRHVVTANKAALAGHWDSLTASSRRTGARLLFSAAVGGGVPAIETVCRLASTHRIRSIAGVLNGTTNFVLDRMAEGESIAEAVARAQARGFAEADPTADLDGTDAARKLAILARFAFDLPIAPSCVSRAGIESVGPDQFRRARAAGQVIRLVASCGVTESGLEAFVRPIALEAEDPLALCRDEGNALRIELEDGPIVTLAGRGAGRWPTSESVFADLLDLWRERDLCRDWLPVKINDSAGHFSSAARRRRKFRAVN